MKGTLARNEYLSVQLSINKKVKTFMVHRLVAEAFCERNSEEDTIVDHIDRNKLNNNANNLRWTTTKENALNAERKENNTIKQKADLTKEWREPISLKGYFVNKDGEIKNKDNIILKGTERNGYIRIKNSYGNFSKHRLIWEAFNGPIPDNMVIDHIDGDRANNALSNLRLITQSENTLNAQANGHAGQVKVKQYDLEGNFIEEYTSFHNAAVAINGSEYAIREAANRHGASANYLWIRDDEEITIEELLKEYNSKKIKKTYIGVSQYDAKGNLINHYNSLREAARELKCADSTIKRAADGKRIGKGFYWILDNQNITIDELIK